MKIRAKSAEEWLATIDRIHASLGQVARLRDAFAAYIDPAHPDHATALELLRRLATENPEHHRQMLEMIEEVRTLTAHTSELIDQGFEIRRKLTELLRDG